MGLMGHLPEKVVALRALLAKTPAKLALEEGPKGLHAKLAEDALEPEALAALDGSSRTLLAMLLAVYLVFAADGEVQEVEIDHLSSLVSALTGGRMDVPDVESTLDALALTLERHGYDACFERVAAVLDSPALRRSAFRLAVGAALVDGELADEEGHVVDRLAKACGLSDGEADGILAELEQALA